MEIQTVVEALSSIGDEQRCLAITKEILAAPPKQIDDRPDGALTVWLSSLGEKEDGVLRVLLKDQTLSEVQRERVLTYAMATREKLGLTFFVEMVPIALMRPAEAKPLGIITGGIDNIVSLARNSDQKSSLASALVPTLPGLSNEPLATVARAINNLNGKGILERNAEVLERMDFDQLTILSREIPGSKVIARYLESNGNEAAE